MIFERRRVDDVVVDKLRRRVETGREEKGLGKDRARFLDDSNRPI